jgi:hypothetical protein
MSFRTISHCTALEAAMKSLSLAMLLSLLPGLAAAGAIEDSMQAFVDTEVRSTLVDPKLVAALNGANAASMAFSPNDILALDDQWRAEIGKESALIKGIAESAMSDLLRDLVQASGGKITEVIVMDAQGLNVAVSTVTSDYWQGDEDKHKLTYGVGPAGVVHDHRPGDRPGHRGCDHRPERRVLLICAAGWRHLHGEPQCSRTIVFRD